MKAQPQVTASKSSRIHLHPSTTNLSSAGRPAEILSTAHRRLPHLAHQEANPRSGIETVNEFSPGFELDISKQFACYEHARLHSKSLQKRNNVVRNGRVCN